MAAKAGVARFPFALVDADSTARSIAFADSLSVSSELSVTYHGDTEGAREAVRRGRSTAMILLPPGFGERLGRFAYGEPANLKLGVDPSRKAEAGMLQAVLFQTAAEFMQMGFSDFNTQKQDLSAWRDTLRQVENQEDVGYVLTFFDALESFLSEEESRSTETMDAADSSSRGSENWGGFTPLKVEELSIQRERFGPPNAFTITFPQGIIWGLLGATAGFALGLVLERRRGTLRRLLASPLGWAKILGGRALACFIFCFLMSLVLILLGVTLFGVQVQQPLYLLLVLLAIALCFTGVDDDHRLHGTQRSQRGWNWLGREPADGDAWWRHGASLLHAAVAAARWRHQSCALGGHWHRGLPLAWFQPERTDGTFACDVGHWSRLSDSGRVFVEAHRLCRRRRIVSRRYKCRKHSVRFYFV